MLLKFPIRGSARTLLRAFLMLDRSATSLVIKDFVVGRAVDLLGITETWLHLK